MDINLIDKKYYIEIADLEGWVPIKIIYGFYQSTSGAMLIWKIHGVDHVFSIHLKSVVLNHKTNYIEHFKLVLQELRLDLLKWDQLNPIQKESYQTFIDKFKHLIIKNT